jgi:anti-sigma factor RsiW
MNDHAGTGCPRVEDISALIDGALTGSAGEEMRMHAAHCPLCGPMLRDFTAMSARLRTLRDVRCDVDMAALVLPHLPKPAAPRRKTVPRWGGLWQFGPRALAGAGALGVGAYLGLLLVAGSGAALRPAAMSVFDGVPPGTLCAGLPFCSPRGR